MLSQRKYYKFVCNYCDKHVLAAALDDPNDPASAGDATAYAKEADFEQARLAYALLLSFKKDP